MMKVLGKVIEHGNKEIISVDSGDDESFDEKHDFVNLSGVKDKSDAKKPLIDKVPGSKRNFNESNPIRGKTGAKLGDIDPLSCKLDGVFGWKMRVTAAAANSGKLQVLGDKIHATVPPHLLNLFRFKLNEGDVYSGKCECILSGDDVGDLEKMLGCGDNGLPLMIVQFAKIRNFRGNVAIQGVLSTRFYVNPSIPEAISFKNGLPVEGVETLSSIPAFGFQPKPAFEDDFLVNYPKISIVNLLESVENGIYVLGATVDGWVEGEDWWFRVKLKVCDGSGQAIFIVFDDDMIKLLGKHCHELVALSKAKNAGYYPPELELLKGIQLLFKVEKNSGRDVPFIGSFRVKRICNDVSVMKAFDSVLGSGDSSSYYGLSVKEEFVEGVQADLVNNVIVLPSFESSRE
ncbi:unnamed protein product [Trifolium pratense]|uniref:Uncharacterized protein n=1 Tax=Trifolium pratense TaxID=57577 RepID=A0ACB0IZS6_TRIPR|nr:unnamed protein product [Trifolium pratense]